jgi:threonine/homoserine/homoserine lactone efflux protein
MNLDQLAALGAFALVTSITPGPNNLMLMASGANYGFRRTIPHMLGVAIGFMLMIVLVGLGLAQVFDAYPASYRILLVASVIYLLYLAWKIATAARPDAPELAGSPFTFVQAALFQWVNPKAWAMALTAASVYAPSRSPSSMVVMALVFGAISLPSVSLWTALGQQIRRWLTNTVRLRVFNISMAILLLASLYPLVGD